MTYIRIFLLIISVRGSLWQECVSIEKDPASKKTNKIRKSDLLLIDLAPGGPGKCSALKRGSCQGRSPVFMKFVLIKGTKGRFSCDNHNDFILFFFSSNTPNSSQLDFQRYWLSIWLPSFSCWCDLLAVDSYKKLIFDKYNNKCANHVNILGENWNLLGKSGEYAGCGNAHAPGEGCLSLGWLCIKISQNQNQNVEFWAGLGSRSKHLKASLKKPGWKMTSPIFFRSRLVTPIILNIS